MQAPPLCCYWCWCWCGQWLRPPRALFLGQQVPGCEVGGRAEDVEDAEEQGGADPNPCGIYVVGVGDSSADSGDFFV